MDGFHEAIPVWERAYAVTETISNVEGAAGTRGADETITEGHFVKLLSYSSYLTAIQTETSLITLNAAKPVL